VSVGPISFMSANDRMSRRGSFPRRSDVRAQGIVLCVCLAVVALVDVSTPGPLDRTGQIKGTDFVEFYVLGSLARDRHVEGLYDPSAERDESVRLIPESRGLQYLPVYGPQVYLFFSPFSRWPYEFALLVWTIISSLIYGICCAIVWRNCPAIRDDWPTVIIVAAAFPAFFNLLLHGQSSALALAFLTFVYIALKDGRPFLAGLALGMLTYKPQLGIVAAAVFMMNREWRVIAGAVVAGVAQLAAGWAYYGTGVINEYVHAMLAIRQINHLLEIKPYQMHSLSAFWELLIPWDSLALSLYIVSAVIVTALSFVVWLSPAPLSLRYSLLLLATTLVCPHLYVYDLVILAPAFLLITDWSVTHLADRLTPPIQRLVYLSYTLPLIGVAAQFTRVQFSVVAMSALSATIARAAMRASVT